MPAGRPTDYSEEVLKKAGFYLANYETYGDIVPSVVGLAYVLNVAKSTLYDWAKVEGNEEFAYTLEKLQGFQEKKLLSGGLSNTFNSTITKLMLANHGYKEKQDVTTDDKPIVNVINYNPAPVQTEELSA